MKFRHTESLPSLAHLDETSSDDDHTASTGSSATPSRPARHVESSVCLHDLDDDSTSSSSSRLVIPPHTGFKKVLVTGGAGFIGSNVAEQLLARGDHVVIVDEMNDYYDVRIKEANLSRLVRLASNNHDPDSLKIYRGDICDEGFMLDLFERERPEWICHMAARAGVRPSIQDPYVYIHSNIRGTTHLMELAHRFGVKVGLMLNTDQLDFFTCPIANLTLNLYLFYNQHINRTLYSHPPPPSTEDPNPPSSPKKKT